MNNGRYGNGAKTAMAAAPQEGGSKAVPEGGSDAVPTRNMAMLEGPSRFHEIGAGRPCGTSRRKSHRREYMTPIEVINAAMGLVLGGVDLAMVEWP